MSHHPRGRPPPLRLALALVGLLILSLPLIGLLARAPWTQMGQLLASPGATAALRLSLTTASVATLVCLVVGIPLAWVLAGVSTPWRNIARGMVALPMVFPPVVAGVALLLVFGRRGIVGRYLLEWFGVQLPFSVTGVVMAETFVAMPFLVLIAESAFRSLDPHFEEAARTLGASAWAAFRRVTLPMCASALRTGTVLCFARALGEFGATITFAGSLEGRTRTVPLEVYLQLESGNLEGAMALSILLLAVSVGALVVLRDSWLGIR